MWFIKEEWVEFQLFDLLNLILFLLILYLILILVLGFLFQVLVLFYFSNRWLGICHLDKRSQNDNYILHYIGGSQVVLENYNHGFEDIHQV